MSNKYNGMNAWLKQGNILFELIRMRAQRVKQVTQIFIQACTKPEKC